MFWNASDEADQASDSRNHQSHSTARVRSIHCMSPRVEYMGIRKILLPLQAAITTEAAFTTAVIVAQMWDAHLAVLDVVPDRTQEGRLRDLFERMVAKHDLAITDAKPDAQTSTVSFMALIGREPDVVAFHARLADV